VIEIVIETLFKNCTNYEEFWRKYKNVLDDFPIISLNQDCCKINFEDIDAIYEKYTKNYSPNFQSRFLLDKILLVGVNSYDDIVKEYSQVTANVIFVSNNKISFSEEKPISTDYFQAIMTFDEVKKNHKVLLKIIELKKQVIETLKKECFEEASLIYKKLADLHNELGITSVAKDYYAFAAIAAERTEKWRNISFLWYSAYDPINKERDYQDYNSLAHTYPSISFEKWTSFSNAEKRGRALQYAAYSDENHGGPSDSYWIFEEAAFEYLNAGNYGRAIECAVSATNRYALCYHQVKPEIMNLWNLLLDSSEKNKYLDLLYISFSDIYRNLNLFQSEEADFFYIQAKKIQQEKLIKNKKYGKFIINKLWSSMTKYGTAISRITVLTLILVLCVFPLSYYICQYGITFNWSEISIDILYNFLKCIKISLNTFFNLDTVPNIHGIFYVLTIVETFYAYIALVVISTSIIGNLLNQKI